MKFKQHSQSILCAYLKVYAAPRIGPSDNGVDVWSDPHSNPLAQDILGACRLLTVTGSWDDLSDYVKTLSSRRTQFSTMRGVLLRYLTGVCLRYCWAMFYSTRSVGRWISSAQEYGYSEGDLQL